MGPEPAGLTEIETVFANFISVIVGLSFIILLIMITAAGIKYILSAGEPKAIQSAHQTLAWAVLGILFMAIAWLLLQLVESFTGVKVTVFDIRQLCQVFPNPIKCAP